MLIKKSNKKEEMKKARQLELKREYIRNAQMIQHKRENKIEPIIPIKIPERNINEAKTKIVNINQNVQQINQSPVLNQATTSAQIPRERLRNVKFINVLEEIKTTIFSIEIFGAILNAAELFLMALLVSMLLKISAIFSVIVGLIYFAVLIMLYLKKNKYKIVEEKYPELREEIMTAADNMHLQNPVVENLHYDIEQKLGAVEVSSFINTREISLKLLSSIILCFVILIVAMLNIGYDYRGIIKNIEDFNYKISGGDSSGNGTAENVAGKGGKQNFYGIEQIAKLGKEELTLTIPPLSYELDTSQISAPEERTFSESPFPDEVFITESKVFEDKTPEKHAQLIKDYFLRITKT